ncbi:MAG: HlyD family type I secretion periplasmic adaptor subunit [Paracoccaceae bacterium]
MTSTSRTQAWPAKMPLAVGVFALAVLVGVIGTWSVHAQIAGAIVSTGIVEVKSNRQVIQHADGGVVGEILVRDGDKVAAGDIVIRLDGSFLQKELTVVEAQLFETLARSARLIAERDGETALTPTQGLAERAATDANIASILAGQERLFTARAKLHREQSELLREDMAQVDNQVAGTAAQLDALAQQKQLVEHDLDNTQTLFDKKLTQASSVSALKREVARLSGEIGALTSENARLLREKTAVGIRLIGLETVRRQDAITELRDLGQQEIELSQRRDSLLERHARLAISAPVAGTIHGTTVFALRSVIRAAEPIMYVVPVGQELIISARIDAVDIDQISIGQSTSLRFPSFDGRSTPELFGAVTQISADAFADEATGVRYYGARVAILDGEAEKLGSQILLPGMPVEVFIKTNERTPLEYLTQPLTDYFTRAFREG